MTHVFYDPDTGVVRHIGKFLPGADLSKLGHYITTEEEITDLRRYLVQDGQLVLREDVPERARADAIHKINTLRGNARKPWITVLPGQDMVYLDKERQALAYLSDPDPEPEDYPGLQAEVGITGETIYEVAQVVANLASLWRDISAHIENVCMTAISEIEEATNFNEIDTAISNTENALEMLP